MFISQSVGKSPGKIKHSVLGDVVVGSNGNLDDAGEDIRHSPI